jgi:hypothetical protein
MTPTAVAELVALHDAAVNEHVEPGRRAHAAEALQMGLWRHRAAIMALVRAHICKPEAA